MSKDMFLLIGILAVFFAVGYFVGFQDGLHNCPKEDSYIDWVYTCPSNHPLCKSND